MSSKNIRETMQLVQKSLEEGNMSYCRWENTASDMSDCVEAMREFHQSADEHEHGPESTGMTTFDTLSDHEKSGYFSALKLAAEMLEFADPEHLAHAGVNLSRLG